MTTWKIAIFALGFFIGATAFGAVKAHLLEDGFALAGVDGKISNTENKVWFFESDLDLNDGKEIVKGGTAVELLPSAGLGKMAADAKSRTALHYRLWGRVTKYQDRNFIFPTYFLPLSKSTQPQEEPAKQQEQQSINEPNDVLTLPQEVLNKLTTMRTVQTERVEKGLELKADYILADRVGFISKEGKDRYIFSLDALGRNVEQSSIRLLPCEVLERALRRQSAELEPIRFKAAGIVTGYEGKDYLLLQRAVQAYDYDNFGR